MSTSCLIPLFPGKRKRNFEPLTATCRPCIVVRPNDLLSRAYSSLPTRINVRCNNFVVLQTGRSKICFHPFSNLGQRLAKKHHTVILVFVTRGPPTLMIPVLLAAARIAPRRLNVSVG